MVLVMKILGIGSYLPERIITNDELSELVDTSDEWISTRTGIKQRHISLGEECSEIAVKAAQRAIEDAGINAEEIDLIIVSTVTPDYVTPGVSCIVQSCIGNTKSICMDLNAACSGFLYALHTVYCYMKAGTAKTALVVSSETLTKILDYSERSTCVLFGDGAGAVVVRQDDSKRYESILGADASKWKGLFCKYPPLTNAYVNREYKKEFLHMDGQEIFKFVIKVIPEVITEVLNKQGLQPSDVNYFILHQANKRINECVAKKLKLDFETKFPMNIESTGNTSSATVPILLDEMKREGKLKSGDKVIMCAFGGGLTWACMLVEW